MATLPAAEQSARKILEHLVSHLRFRPGRAILDGQVEHLPIPRPEVIEGIVFALAKGWVEKTEDGRTLLTHLGFSQT